MNLLQKLNSVNTPRVSPLQAGKTQTIEEFWTQFIEPHLPETEVVLRWHDVLMEYVKRPEAMFAIRGYNTAAKINYDRLRRGFLTCTNAGYSFFYTDNFHAAYYLKMAMDGYVPTVDEMISAYTNRQFPARFGRDTSNERAMMAMPKGVDPEIQNVGYKIAHILNVGKDYSIQGEIFPLSKIITKYFDGGQRSDWNLHTDETGTYYLRSFDVKFDARKYLVAEFLRFVHPFNYFLTPKKNCSRSMVCSDIAEYQPLIEYVQQKFSRLYGSAYQEYLELVMPVGNVPCSASGNIRIDLEYALNLTGATSIRPATKHTDSNAIPKPQQKQIAEHSVQVTKDMELRIVAEYLSNPDTSFRKLERQFMGIDSKARGGGFEAKRIVNSYGVTADLKGVLAHRSIAQLVETATGQFRSTLLEIVQKK